MKYDLYDLEITVVGDEKTFNCSHKAGDTLLVKGTEQFSHYALAALTPYIAAKQRAKQKSDWLYYETDIACPDPKCCAVFRFNRIAKTQYIY
jgi:uncharacterized repeat protein (TIGR04076 family)